MNIQGIIKKILLFSGSIIYRNKNSKILFYHDVYNTTCYKSVDTNVLLGTHIEIFKEHIRIIKEEGYDIVTHITKPKKEVAIMFDDGFRGIWDNRNFFYENDIKPTVFIAKDLIGEPGFLSVKEILELQGHGFNFESHSWTHTDLTQYSDKNLERELLQSKKWLSEMLGKEVSEICLPIGYFSNHLIEQTIKYGYKEVYSSVPGNFKDLVLNTLRRRNLCQFATPFEVKCILRGGGNMLASRYYKLHKKVQKNK